MRMFARSGGNPIDEAYNNMHLALTGWAAPDGSGSLDISDPDLRQNLVLAGFENLPEDDGELQEWAKARQYLIKRHAEKAYKMYGKQNNDVRLDNVKLHLVEETSNQDTFINFTLDNKKILTVSKFLKMILPPKPLPISWIIKEETNSAVVINYIFIISIVMTVWVKMVQGCILKFLDMTMKNRI